MPALSTNDAVSILQKFAASESRPLKGQPNKLTVEGSASNRKGTEVTINSAGDATADDMKYTMSTTNTTKPSTGHVDELGPALFTPAPAALTGREAMELRSMLCVGLLLIFWRVFVNEVD